MSENKFQCQPEADADFICDVLITELSSAKTLQLKVKIADAILNLRQFVKPMIVEWEHINGMGCCYGVTENSKSNCG
jgi:hypothetical protein